LAVVLPLEADLFHNERLGACQLKERQRYLFIKHNDPTAKVKGGRVIIACRARPIKSAADRMRSAAVGYLEKQETTA
jgi:hypothetical protein